METKKYIAPGAWFTMEYPAAWNEFEGGEGAFLFYNPDVWNGNFRISAYRGNSTYGMDTVEQELKENKNARPVKVGDRRCAYWAENFQENGERYVTHFWITGMGDMAFECSFTVPERGDVRLAETVIASLGIREEGKKYPPELIPVRLSEIYLIDEGYKCIEQLIKERLKQDFRGTEDDLANLQKIIDSGVITPKKRDTWLAIGIVICIILANEVDETEWRTLVDGNREAPVLLYKGKMIDPMKLAWSKVKSGEKCDVLMAYNNILEA